MKLCVARACLAVLAVLAFATAASPADALAPNGDQGWFWQMPQPTGGWMADVAFGDSQNVWAVGGGSILRSPDAGASWQSQASIPQGQLESVAFGDAQHGLACGMKDTSVNTYGPLLVRTGDGGATWTEATPAKVLYGLDSLSMSDAAHAWMADQGGQLWTTADGGLTWSRRTVGTYRDSLAVATLDGSRGWAGGSSGRVWRTRNGGATWTRLSTGLPPSYWVVELQCGAGHIWALALDDGHPQPRYRLIVSTDGGARWRVVCSTSDEVSDLYASGDDAWLVSSLSQDPLWGRLDSILASTVAHLRHTADGGATWTKTVINSSIPPYALDANGAELCAVGAGTFTSSDGGQSWLARTSSRSYSITAAAAVSATDIWAVDFTGSVLHSSDGVSWVEQDISSRWSQSLTDVSFPDAQHGWMIGSTGHYYDGEPLILATGDGGQTWTPSFSALPGPLTAVDFVDDLHGWVAASGFGPFSRGRQLERTTDGGLQWIVQQPDPTLDYIKLLDFVDVNIGWVEGAYMPSDFSGQELPEAVFRTTDGGASWQRYPLAKNTGLIAMQFLDATDGWAIAVKGTNTMTVNVVHTTDGGVTWSAIPQFANLPAEAVHFLDAQTGWVSVDGDGIYETNDAGMSWQRKADSETTAEIVASDASHVWALGTDIVSTVDTNADTAPPATWTDADDAWHRTAQTITLSGTDIGGSGLAASEYSLDLGDTWQLGDSITFDAPPDHSNDGFHTILYRSRDNAGNREASQPSAALIDTLGPVCTAPRKAVVNAGSNGILRFNAVDATSGVRRATITISDNEGRVRKTFVRYAGIWSSEPAPSYYWLRFACNLKPGYYRITVRAADYAGNQQTTTGHNFLHVVRAGAPKQTHPWWPPGLPDSSMTGASFAGDGTLSRARPIDRLVSLVARPQ